MSPPATCATDAVQGGAASAARECSAVAWLERLARRECSARELAQDRLRRLEDCAALGAVVALDPERVLREADAADAERAAGERRPLLGLPVTVKDALDVAGYVTGGGSAGRSQPAAQDATTVARLRAAGAIVLAKTNVPEACAGAETVNAAFGRTLHPLDPARTPGGSSGGEAALLGAGASIAGLGSDTGCSIRLPAHYCGIAGMRPTVGRTPETGIWPATRASGLRDLTCVGPLARHVEDLELLLATIAGPDGVDPYATPVPLARSETVEPARLRVAFYDHDPRAAGTTAATRAAVRAAAGAFERLGCAVEQIEPPGGASATELFFAAIAADGGAGLLTEVAPAAGNHDASFVRALARRARNGTTVAGLFAIERDVDRLRRRVRALFTRHDVVLAPVAAGPAPCHGEAPGKATTGDPMLAYEPCHTFALGGVPVVVVPVAREDGLPLGVQVAAGAFRDHVALAAAGALEQAIAGSAA